MDELTTIRKSIRNKGFMSATQIVLDIASRNPHIERSEVDKILESLPCEDILKLEYTNAQTSDYRVKELFYHMKEKSNE